MLAVDEMVGALVEELEALGELENTYIIFTSDNGWFQGEHRIQGARTTRTRKDPTYRSGSGDQESLPDLL